MLARCHNFIQDKIVCEGIFGAQHFMDEIADLHILVDSERDLVKLPLSSVSNDSKYDGL